MVPKPTLTDQPTGQVEAKQWGSGDQARRQQSSDSESGLQGGGMPANTLNGHQLKAVAASLFERANQVVARRHYDFGIRLLLDCCKMDPANLLYRQALRRTEKAKYRNNLRGSRWAWLTTWLSRRRLKAAREAGEHLRVLELGERILVRNPWDVGVQMTMASSADALGDLNLAIWILEQAHQKEGANPLLNRALARLYQKRGNFTQAIDLWELLRKADPADVEATGKIRDLSTQLPPSRVSRESDAPRVDNKDNPSNGSTSVENSESVSEQGLLLTREAAVLRARLNADTTNSQLYLELARLYRRAGDLERARQVLHEGLGATGQVFALSVELADLDTEPFRLDLVIADRQLANNPDDLNLRRLRAQLYKEVNTRELDLYRQLTDRFPGTLQHRYELGIRLLRVGQLEEAISELQASRACGEYRWQSLLALGHCFKTRNNWRLAQRNFEEALEALPRDEETQRKAILFELACGLVEVGNLAAALDYAHDLANLDYTYRDIHQLLDLWQVRLRVLSGNGELRC